MTTAQPLTLGTAGHIDHGKTALVAALTGRNTDRLPAEKARGISIELGYAPLRLTSGRRLSVVDAPGHERFVRTMVAGATGIDLYLMVVAADDGVMPQTREHAAVLDALAVATGVVAVTKADITDPARAAQRGERVAPARDDRPVLGAHRRRRRGRARGPRRGRRAACPTATPAPASRCCTSTAPSPSAAPGTVVTGTLWAGSIAPGDRLVLLPAGTPVRVRSVQIHDEPVDRADAGQRVAVNLVGVERRDVARGDVVAAAGAVAPSLVLDCELTLHDATHGMRAHVHHGTRETPARLADLGGGLWQARLEQPLLARAGDRVVVRSIAPPDTLGGGVVLDPAARRHGRRDDALARLERLRRGEPEPAPEPAAAPAPRPAPGCARPAARLGPGARGAPARRGPRAAERRRPRGRRPRRPARGRARGARGARDVRAPRRAGGGARPSRGRRRRRRGDHAGPSARRASDLAQVRPGAPRAPRRRARDQAPARRLARPAPRVIATRPAGPRRT